PTDHGTLDAAGRGGLYASGDGSATWAPTLPTDWRVVAFAVSPADRKRLYAVLADPSEPRRAHWLRSDDGGGTWSTLEAVEPPERCLGFEYAYAVLLLQPDAIDRDRVYRADMRREDGWLRGDA